MVIGMAAGDFVEEDWHTSVLTRGNTKLSKQPSCGLTAP
jgi:hypothetical protein